VYLLICVLTKSACDPKMKHTDKLVVAFINVAITLIPQQPIGTSSVLTNQLILISCGNYPQIN